ncbi:hypothetical protein M409DRAFT_54563 [Zasmidium cellare ATCC 36951]|uniref:SMP-30/Gluconolactonase/LRE-like region domain-containing protein n=1 Tax=Zasmidium cellare ATCC 36951 TaxID=1080233 RepID=A0A6A6CI15_ZASCE|nr:uncharacterized protein M409DRAFT_54563 [Zasmidium cellare ATCC 36951]KAF2166775.1 hypothetical protein M409DRAFT_54563 [Zasmidium cellare ATCC 36951]
MHFCKLLFPLFIAATNAATLRRLYQWPNNTATSGLENISVRPCGELVITTTSEPCIYTLDPQEQSPTPEKIHCFQDATATTGIAEIFPDVFAVHVGSLGGSTNQSGVKGSWSIWIVDFNRGDGTIPAITKFVSISQAGTLNGMTVIPGQWSLLSVDSELGLVWKASTITAQHSIAGNNSAFLPSSDIPLGLNGMHIDPNAQSLYVTNTANKSFGTTHFNSKTDIFSGFRTLAHPVNGTFFDDFAVDWKSQLAYVTEHANRIVTIDLHTGKKEVVVDGPQNDVGPFQPTSAAFGRNHCLLYIVSNEYTDQTTGANSNGQVFEVQLC